MSYSHRHRDNSEDSSSAPRNQRLHQRRQHSQKMSETMLERRFITPAECVDWSDDEVWQERHVSRSYSNQTLCANWLRHVHPGLELIFVLLVLCTPPTMLLIPFIERLLGAGYRRSAGSESMFRKSELQSTCNLDCETRMVNLAVRYFLLCISFGMKYTDQFKAVINRPNTCFSSLITCEYQRGERSWASALDLPASLLTFIAFISYWTDICSKVFGLLRVRDDERIESTSPFDGGNPFLVKAESSLPNGNKVAHVGFATLSKYASDFVDMQLIILLAKTVLGRCILRLRSLKYCIHAYRSPDGRSFVHQVDAMEIGEAAEQIILSLACDPQKEDPLIVNPKRKRRKSINDFELDLEDPVSDGHSRSHCRSGSLVGSVFKCNEATGQGHSYAYYSVEDLSPRPREAGTSAQSIDKVIGSSQPECSNRMVNSKQTRKSGFLLSTMDAQRLNELASKRNRLQVNFELALRKRRAALRELVNFWFDAVRTEDWCKVEKGSLENYRQHIKAATLLIYDQISRRLIKYLTMIGQRQQHHETAIRWQIELYLTCNMSADAFLNQYFQFHPKIVKFPNPIERKSGDTGLTNWNAPDEETVESSKTDNEEKERIPCKPQLKREATRTSHHQTWKIHLGDQSIHDYLKHGLRFRLSRAETTVICCVYSNPVCQLQPAGKNYHLTMRQVQMYSGGIPASTMETSITNSEQFI